MTSFDPSFIPAAIPLRLLLFNLHFVDQAVILDQLQQAGFYVHGQALSTPQELSTQLQQDWDLILAESPLPNFTLEQLLETCRSHWNLPVILMGQESEDQIVEYLKRGVADYLKKDDLQRLGRSAKQALQVQQYRLQQQQRQLALQQREQRFRTLIENATELILILDPLGNITYTSPSVQRLLGYLPDDLCEQTIFDLVHPQDTATFQQCLLPPGEGAPPRQKLAEFRMRHYQGYWCVFEAYTKHLLHDPAVAGIIVNAHDITTRKQTEAQLFQQAFYDSISRLPNRTYFLDRLRGRLHQARTEADPGFAVFFIDLDQFQMVKYSLGHRLGDQLLVGTARQFQTCLQPQDLLARIGEDEFAILRHQVNSQEEAIALAQKLQHSLMAPFKLDGRDVFASCTIGIALSHCPNLHFPASSHSSSLSVGEFQAEDWLRAADTAMYQARLRQNAPYAVFDPSMYLQAVERLQLESDLRQAIQRQEFEVYYQPIIELKSGRLAGFEALLRWFHTSRGPISPSIFIPLAEETGFILPLGRWVLQAACRQLQQWQQFPSIDPRLTLSVNLSAKQFSQPGLLNQIDRILQETGVNGAGLKLELTESSLLDNAETAAHLLRALRDRKIQTSIDDFGTGYSCLSYLHRLPVNTLKIDRSFVHQIGAAGGHAEIVRTVVTLAKNLQMDVTAEGVETVEQLMQLANLNCDRAQGYFFSQPVDAETATTWLGKRWFFES